MRAIPWAAILAEAPALMKAADGVLSGARKPAGPPPASADALQRALARIDSLEAQAAAQAHLLTDVTQQLAALASATDVLAARQRWLLGLAAAALLLSAIAIVVAAV